MMSIKYPSNVMYSNEYGYLWDGIIPDSLAEKRAALCIFGIYGSVLASVCVHIDTQSGRPLILARYN